MGKKKKKVQEGDRFFTGNNTNQNRTRKQHLIHSWGTRCQSSILHRANVCSMNKGGITTFSGIQELKEPVISRPALRETSRGALPAEGP